MAVSNYDPYFRNSILGTVLLEGYQLLTLVTLILFLDKDDMLALIPRYGYFTWMIRKTVERFFYPLFLFCISLIIIFSPCMGYNNLGWWLCSGVPLSALIFSAGYFGTELNRTYTQQLFLSNSDLESEVVENFEHARFLYGIYIVLSFVCIWIAVWAAFAYLWTGDFKLAFLWKSISETWAIPYGDKSFFGLVQFCAILIFILVGYFAASITEQFILKKIFEIFKIDAGLENTISKIFQYISIIFFFVLALATLNLTDCIKWVGAALVFGIGLGMRDQLADIFAGILILIERQIEKDHYIEFNEDKTNYRGTVHKMSLRSTTIRTVRNFFVSIPNKLLISRPVINWGAGRAAIGMEFDVKVAYGADPETICSIIKQIIYENPSIMRVPAALVRLDEFSEYGMVFFARAFIHARRVREQWDIAANIRLEIIKAFKTNNIELAYPSTLVRFESKEGVPEDAHPFKIRLDSDEESRP
jgi:small-conductance mechanosensitive channel